MSLSKSLIQQIIQQKSVLNDLSDNDLAEFCQQANEAYRQGNPIVSDQDYDFIYLAELNKRLPGHKLFQSIEPEGQGFSDEKVLLPEIMLSTDKAYSWAEIQKWIERLEKSCLEIDIDINDIEIKATPKLDGFAGYDDGKHLYTRGDGKKGSDITRVFDRGLQVFNASERGQGAGEIVIKKCYFEKYLADSFEYPRNFQASLIKEKALDDKAKQAIADKAALFVPFAQLPKWIGSINKMIDNFETIINDILSMVDFDVDGVVFEAIDQSLKNHMGANRKFHRWQIAYKENKDKAQVKVLGVTPQVGRTGKITPVAELEPTQLSGATIVRATGHHYGLVKEQGLGEDSIVELTRSGLVIPKIIKVLKPAEISIPEICPSCSSVLTWQSDFLMCINHVECPAQIIGKMEYFFKILANNDGFGIATIEKLYEHGIRKISQIYQLNEQDFANMGFGDKTSQNLFNQLKRSFTQEIEDWRFLAAFGINRMGMGNCENLLKSYSIKDIFKLNESEIANINGFATLSAALIVDGLKTLREEYDCLLTYKFNLELTSLEQVNSNFSHPLVGKKVVFTGKMQGSRDEMKKHAKSIGIQVVLSVTGKTDYLIIGDKVGQKKIESAEKFGVKILSEADYINIITQ
ncbi:DNA ligase (NAD(+)) (EC 6.5.1.2) [uncultured Gammaproteobacteria bacterium]|uniref:BRCT domain-containing protein n=1 Tax=Bathymodiolus heckerae thiotrophic gill symbiont TaxID=1052212 RepID=UPI0010AEFE98|nr:BRCT domain-containing protein [Bathymodiolus heckerae thiotrophic gill symbiont]CAC9544630.1 DNA ligase (NAD(+)) (EC 6.5.1.2) [uncultured Gammaproteobacteria bacterium]CAC9600072.1 DNA ligase (NAD(+)) (EC 6.5.1.2) [uncultured Gammaproteobacteria bacterium]SHN89851.1 DNA ligase [Bathymodiolus heckerae thiotrophic gill symbiont]